VANRRREMTELFELLRVIRTLCISTGHECFRRVAFKVTAIDPCEIRRTDTTSLTSVDRVFSE
jgi:hypothetical protein